MIDGDLKIQLEDVQDLKFLRQEFGKYLESNALTTTDLQRQRVLETGDPPETTLDGLLSSSSWTMSLPY